MKVLLVVCNVPDAILARQMAETLVGERLAACVNILPGCESVYRWQGKLESASEIPLLIKTTDTVYAALERRIQELHPYEVAEIIALPIVAGLAAYQQWVAEETGGGQG
ncbi:divalent-cation tolerance protein CutA [Vogesella sp. LIG4]|uniref:divalent-cation tolerance protein CutA n=1 Tax=Vogesella sp. LIG4 TaxID=1192162 RepID=UPI00081F9A88|nr:divalent-cation tolerance protein CutA [Vogesella sp. LIG4]SCK10412.1 divalent cation tolerance protein [Vogesella sp. LIG4]